MSKRWISVCCAAVAVAVAGLGQQYQFGLLAM